MIDLHPDDTRRAPEGRLDQQQNDGGEERERGADEQARAHVHHRRFVACKSILAALSNHFPEVQDLSVCVVLPAYHAAKTLKATLDRLPSGACHDIILVDDASTDDTIDVARELGIKVHRHPENRGYGGNQKTCYRLALETEADIVVMLHPDNQYDGALVPFMTGFIKAGVVDIVLGSRISRREEVLAGGMPPIKYIANRFLTILENIVLGLNLPEYHTGYRAYHRRVLETVNFEACSDDFVFDQHFLVQARVHGLAHRGRACADALRTGIEQHPAGTQHEVRVRHARGARTISCCIAPAGSRSRLFQRAALDAHSAAL